MTPVNEGAKKLAKARIAMQDALALKEVREFVDSSPPIEAPLQAPKFEPDT